MGVKQIETRNWATAYRGPLLIHASKSKAGRVMMTHAMIQAHITDFNDLPFGAIIGQATLTGIVAPGQQQLPAAMLRQLTLEEQAFGDYEGKYCWLLEEAITFEEVIPATGHLGLWEF